MQLELALDVNLSALRLAQLQRMTTVLRFHKPSKTQWMTNAMLDEAAMPRAPATLSLEPPLETETPPLGMLSLVDVLVTDDSEISHLEAATTESVANDHITDLGASLAKGKQRQLQ